MFSEYFTKPFCNIACKLLLRNIEHLAAAPQTQKEDDKEKKDHKRRVQPEVISK